MGVWAWGQRETQVKIKSNFCQQRAQFPELAQSGSQTSDPGESPLNFYVDKNSWSASQTSAFLNKNLRSLGACGSQSTLRDVTEENLGSSHSLPASTPGTLRYPDSLHFDSKHLYYSQNNPSV